MNEELQKNLDEINKLPGLKKVKEEVKALIAFLENSKDREKQGLGDTLNITYHLICLLYTSPSPRDGLLSRMPSSA